MQTFRKLGAVAASSFAAFDTDHNGVLDFEEFGALVRAREGEQVSEERLRARFAELDEDGNGTVSLTEYISFSLLEGRVLLRHYQLVPPADARASKGEGVSLVEIGPRCALVPIRVLAGCFRGETLFTNEAYVSPNVARAALKRKRARTTVGAVAQKEKRRNRIASGYDALPEDEFGDVFT